MIIHDVGRSLAVAGVALFALAGDTPAQDADTREVSAYRFTDATLAKYVRAARALAALAKSMPVDTSGDARDEEDEGDSGSGTKSIAEITAGYDSVPGARRAITSAGLTTREYVVFSFALLQAGLAAFLVEQQGWDKLPPDVARSNVEFYQRHKAALDSVGAELRPRQ
ncbi:MAG TPA: hypothetical protein VJ755_02870 [Gemmatimonadales bacterium]|nr:hypothetical protein [Gemmatimonadales bacterium]